MRPIQGDIPQHTRLLYMEKFRFLHPRNRFYKTDTKSRILPLQTKEEAGNDTESKY